MNVKPIKQQVFTPVRPPAVVVYRKRAQTKTERVYQATVKAGSFLNQRPSNFVVSRAAGLAKIITPLAFVVIFGPVGLMGTILLFPVIRQVASRITTVTGNVFTNMVMTPFRRLSPGYREEQLSDTDNKSFTVSVLGSMAGEAVWAVFLNVICPFPVLGFAKNAVKVVVVSPVKQCGRAAFQYGHNQIFGVETCSPSDYLSIQKPFGELLGTCGEQASVDCVNSSYDCDGIAEFAVRYAGAEVGMQVGKGVWNLGKTFVSALRYEGLDQEMFELIYADDLVKIHANGDG